MKLPDYHSTRTTGVGIIQKFTIEVPTSINSM